MKTKYIEIGTKVSSRFGTAKVTGIEMVEEGRKDGGIEMDKIFYADKDRLETLCSYQVEDSFKTPLKVQRVDPKAMRKIQKQHRQTV